MPDRPNVVVILSDQQRWDTLACYGNDWIQTPRLNRLAEESAVFEAAYVTQPVCVPARASIMTGLYPALRRTGRQQDEPRPQHPSSA